MKRILSSTVAAGVMVALSACSTLPENIESLETARAIVPQVENSPRAGVAATYVSEARQALDRANELYERGADLEAVEHAANLAATNAQIANQKILAAQARDEIEQGKAERQTVLIEARERQAQMRLQEAQDARAQADAASQRASQLQKELEELKARPTERGMVVTLGDVLFDTAQATLKPGAYQTMDRVAQVLKRDSERELVIEGHTDSRGSDEYNMQLSERRADAVRNALIERGVRADQIRALGKGENFPVASNETSAGQQQNRRVDLIFSEGDQGSQVASDTN